MVQWKARHKWCLLIQDHKPRLNRGKTSLESIIPEIRGSDGGSSLSFPKSANNLAQIELLFCQTNETKHYIS